MDADATQQLLWDTYDPYSMWLIFGLIGTGSLIALLVYNHFVTAANADPNHSFNKRGDMWVKAFLFPICAIMIISSFFFPSTGLILNTLFFCMMAVIALQKKGPLSADS